MMKPPIFNLSLTTQQVNVILLSLSKQPLELVLETFVAIKEQVEKEKKSPDGVG
ncbi:MAG: hypothetical protein ACOY4R_27855 [Pseudomonadota bacterium]